MCITEQKLVDAYANGNPHERFSLIYKNYEIYAGYESERYCRNGGYHAITGGKIHPCRTAEAAPVLCSTEMDGQSMSISKEKRCLT